MSGVAGVAGVLAEVPVVEVPVEGVVEVVTSDRTVEADNSRR